MGNSVGNIKIMILDNDVITPHAFIYKIESCDDETCNVLTEDLSLKVLTTKSKPSLVALVPSGVYKITIIPTWSWRYNEKVTFKVTENSITKDNEIGLSVRIRIYSEKTTDIETDYVIENKKWLSKLTFGSYK